MIADIAWPIAIAVAALAFWDIGRKWVAGYEFGNQKLTERYDAALRAHDEKHEKVAVNLLRQMREEVDSLSGEVNDNVTYTRRKHNEPETGKLEPWQQKRHEDRMKMRARR